MQVHHLAKDNSVLNTFLAEIRSTEIQQDSMRFRRNIERIGEILGYELSKSLSYISTDVTTPLGIKTIDVPNKNLVLASVLRAVEAVSEDAPSVEANIGVVPSFKLLPPDPFTFKNLLAIFIYNI